jgi:hypothetical protein
MPAASLPEVFLELGNWRRVCGHAAIGIAGKIRKNPTPDSGVGPKTLVRKTNRFFHHVGGKSMRCFMVGVYLVAAMAIVASTCSGDDAAIAREVAEKLRYQQEQKNLHGFHITVKVEDGTVWMMGDVADSNQRDLALDVARRVSDVQLVVNDLNFGENVKSSPLAHQEESDLAASIPAPKIPPAPTAAEPDKQAIMPAAHNMFAGPSPTTAASAVARPVRPQLNAANQPIGTGVGYQTPMQAHPVHVAQVPGNGHGPVNTAAVAGYAPHATTGYCQNCVNGGGAVNGHFHGGGVVSDRIAGHGDAYGNGVGAYGGGGGNSGISSGQPQMPNYAWPSYASYPNYGAVTYPRQYSPQAWPYIGPFYPYPQVPLGWRKVALEWDDGWWMLDFSHK